MPVLTDCIDFHTFSVGHSSVGASSPAEGCEECLTKIERVMAKPIAPTPSLNAEEAKRLLEMMENVKPISKEARERMKRNYEFIRSIATFDLPECNW